MKIIMAYAAILVIFSTTPLGIKWSNSSLSFSTAITLRMLLALCCCMFCLWLTKKPLIMQRRDWLAFLAGALGLFPNMLIIYWSAQYISSGLMSLLLGFLPFFAGFFSWLFLRENILSASQCWALVVALCGLWLIHYDQAAFSAHAVWGVLGMLLVAAIWGASTVWVKFLGMTIEPLRQSSGSLLIATPCFVIYWLLFDAKIPTHVDTKSWLGVGYLVLAGSLVGHTVYFYVLRVCSIVATSALTLLTPIAAIILGAVLLNERLTVWGLLGAGLIVVSLGFYSGVFKVLWRRVYLLLAAAI